MYPRLVEACIREALSDTPVVLVVGPRRAGKTTLARAVGGKDRPYLTLDDQTTLDAARTNPVAFVRDSSHATIDEIQRVPDLLLAIKKAVDDDPGPGRFLLTGSANVLTLPKVADSLAGRKFGHTKLHGFTNGAASAAHAGARIHLTSGE